MAGNKKKALKTIIPLALGGFLIWLSFSKLTDQDLEDVKTAFQTANYWWILLSLFLGVLSHFSRAYRWQFMLEPLGYKPKFLNSAMAVIIAYLVNLGIPRAGELSRAAALAEYENVPFEKGFGTIVAERVADVLMYILCIFLAFLAQYELIKHEITSKFPEDPLYTILVVASLGVGFYLFFQSIKKIPKTFFHKITIFSFWTNCGCQKHFENEKKMGFSRAYALYLGHVYPDAICCEICNS